MNNEERLAKYREEVKNNTLRGNLYMSFKEYVSKDKNETFKNIDLYSKDIIECKSLLYNILKTYKRIYMSTEEVDHVINKVVGFINRKMIYDKDAFSLIVYSIGKGKQSSIENYLKTFFNNYKSFSDNDAEFLKFLIAYFYKVSDEKTILNFCTECAYNIIIKILDNDSDFYLKTNEIDINDFIEIYGKIKCTYRSNYIDLIYRILYEINLPQFTDYNDNFYMVMGINKSMKELKFKETCSML